MNAVTVLVILATVGFSSAVSRTMIINTTVLSIKFIKLLFTTYEVVYSRINIFYWLLIRPCFRLKLIANICGEFKDVY